MGTGTWFLFLLNFLDGGDARAFSGVSRERSVGFQPERRVVVGSVSRRWGRAVAAGADERGNGEAGRKGALKEIMRATTMY